MKNVNHNKYDHINPKILEFVLESGLKNPTILDVGCWRGALGEAIKKNIDCTIDGVDISDGIEEAKGRGYRNLYKINLDSNFDPQTIKGKYDIVVLGDVLEHTTDPECVLTKIKKKVNRHGKMIVSLPNVGFLLYRITHLMGRWEYKEIGVMDETHLRFFTVRSMNTLFYRSSLRVVRQDGIAVVRRRYFFLSYLAGWLPSLFALQIVTMVTPKRTSQ